MKITIDTRHDHPEDIRKVIALLTHLSGKRPMANFETCESKSSQTKNIFEEQGTQETGFASMFGSDDKEPDSHGAEQKEKIEIIPY
ncbi:MAG: hypothetical protein ABIF10_02580 [Candidatus Woesearchaeota archaeon]